MSKAVPIEEECPMEISMNVLNGKWKLKILWMIAQRPHRFNELQKELGEITTRTLTIQLRELERDGLVTRTIYPEIPPHVEYALTTPLGKSILPVLHTLCEWGKGYLAAREIPSKCECGRRLEKFCNKKKQTHGT